MDWTHTGLKPLSANQMWLGAKRKSREYRKYETHLLRTLPDLDVPTDTPLELRLVVYYSSRASDIDNCLKPFIDVLQKRYGIDDKYIYKLRATKVLVRRGDESIKFMLLPTTENSKR